jgi:hypothetical protein
VQAEELAERIWEMELDLPACAALSKKREALHGF